MTRLDIANVRALLDRFFRCDDGVLKDLYLDLGSDDREPSATIELSVRDSVQDPSGEAWANLRLRLDRLQEFCLVNRDREECKVLSNGLHIAVFNGRVFVDFGLFTEDTSTLEEFRSSPFYLAGEELSWEVAPYRR